ncbi:MAG TPA: hypothetical protein VHT23_10965, partial [Gemmatimonadaceae bacterium]|nr:hypothetical protein [Gemmatimonadaceae bacterium]
MEVCFNRKHSRWLGALTVLVVAGCGTSTDNAKTPPTAVAGYRTNTGAVNIYAEDGANNLAPEAARAKPLVYVPNSRSGTVTIIDPKTYEVVRTFPTGKVP